MKFIRYKRIALLAIVASTLLIPLESSAQRGEKLGPGPSRVSVKTLLWAWSNETGNTIVMDDGLNGGDRIGAVDFIVPYRQDADSESVDFEDHNAAAKWYADQAGLSLSQLVNLALKQKKHLLAYTGTAYEIFSINDAMTSVTTTHTLESILAEGGNDEVGFVTLTANINNIDANSVRTALAPLITRGGQVVPIGRDKLLIADYFSNAKRLARVIKMMDQDQSVEGYRIPEIVHPEVFNRVAVEVAGIKGELFADARRFVYRCPANRVERTKELLDQCAAALKGE